MAYEYVLSLSGEEGTRFVAAKKVYDANVIRHFLPGLRAFAMIGTEDMLGGVSKDTIRWYKMVTAKKVDHAAMPKQKLTKKIVTLRLEDDETVSASTLSKKDELIVHYDASGAMSKSAGEAMAQKYELQTLIQAILAARTAADGVFPGGQQVTRIGFDSLLKTYPMSPTGSERLQNDIKSAHRLLFEDDVPDSLERYWFMRKREHDVLIQDNLLMSRDYVGETFSDKIKGKLTMIDGAWIIPSNIYPQSDLSAPDDDTPTKNGVNSYLINATDSVACCLTSEALRKAELEPVTGLYYWDDDNRNWTIGAVGFKTIEIFRPECAAEIRWAAA